MGLFGLLFLCTMLTISIFVILGGSKIAGLPLTGFFSLLICHF